MTSAEFDEVLRALLARVSAAATSSRQRQLVALTGAYLDGDPDRAHFLAREHLIDHPDDVLAVWISAHTRPDLEQS